VPSHRRFDAAKKQVVGSAAGAKEHRRHETCNAKRLHRRTSISGNSADEILSREFPAPLRYASKKLCTQYAVTASWRRERDRGPVLQPERPNPQKPEHHRELEYFHRGNKEFFT
jgi:hypothetical protein